MYILENPILFQGLEIRFHNSTLSIPRGNPASYSDTAKGITAAVTKQISWLMPLTARAPWRDRADHLRGDVEQVDLWLRVVQEGIAGNLFFVHLILCQPCTSNKDYENSLSWDACHFAPVFFHWDISGDFCWDISLICLTAVLKLTVASSLACIFRHSGRNDLTLFSHFKTISVSDRQMTEKKQLCPDN